MPSNKDYTELIEQYLDGELSEKELASFEQELSVNTELQQELEFYELAYTGVVQHKFSEVEATLQEVKQEFVSGKKRQKMKNYLAVSALVVLSGAGLFYALQESPSEKEPTTTQEDLVVDTLAKENANNEIEFPSEKKEAELKQNKPTEPNAVSPEKSTSGKKKVVPTPLERTKDTLVQAKEKKNEIAVDSSVVIKELKPVIKQEKSAEIKQETAKESTNDPLPCDKISITSSVTTKESCKGSEEGIVTISKTTGGTAPYKYELSNGKKTSSSVFTNLGAGKYTIYVTDHNNCEETLEVVVKEKLCKLNLYYDPSSGQPLVLPEYENAGYLSIFDKQGALKFSDQLEPNRAYEWFGSSNSGTLAPGYYVLLIKFEDGKVQNGSITITP